jgi:hypothetical protein
MVVELAMNRSRKIEILNRLLRILNGSLPGYLESARPWSRRNGPEIEDALAALSADQKRYAQRIAQIVQTHGGRLDPGRFPGEFTSIHDLAIEYLLGRIIEHQGRDVEAIRQCAGELADEPALQALAEEALANQRNHLEALKAIASAEQ